MTQPYLMAAADHDDPEQSESHQSRTSRSIGRAPRFPGMPAMLAHSRRRPRPRRRSSRRHLDQGDTCMRWRRSTRPIRSSGTSGKGGAWTKPPAPLRFSPAPGLRRVPHRRACPTVSTDRVAPPEPRLPGTSGGPRAARAERQVSFLPRYASPTEISALSLRGSASNV
jgi:hypothetical protein